MVVDLPLAGEDAAERLLAVAKETRERKRLHDAETLAEFFADVSPVALAGAVRRTLGDSHVFTLNVSNVPGPPEPQRVLGARLLHLYSFAEIAHRHALRVAVVSAAGQLGFGPARTPTRSRASTRSRRESRTSSAS